MANLDTPLKRLSGINVSCPWRGLFPFPDGTISQADRQTTAYFYSGILAAPTAAVAVISGTILAFTTEGDIQLGGKVITITLTNDQWVAAGAAFNAQRQNIINGFVSAQGEANGWNAVVQAGLPVSAVVRTSNTQVTITLPAFPLYDITALETITETIPASALTTSLVPVVATPSFQVTPVAPTPTTTATPGRRRLRIPDLAKVEDEATKRERRAREAALEAPVPPVADDARAEDYKQESRRLTTAIERVRGQERQFRQESDQLRQRIVKLEAQNRERQLVKARKDLLVKEQAIQLAQVEEAMLLEQMELADIRDVVMIALTMIMQ